jgi:hypothetical protein
MFVTDSEKNKFEHLENNLKKAQEETSDILKDIRNTWKPFIELVTKWYKLSNSNFIIKGFKQDFLFYSDICYVYKNYFISIDRYSIEVYEKIKKKFNTLCYIGLMEYDSISYQDQNLSKIEEIFNMLKQDYAEIIEKNIVSLTFNNEMKKLTKKPIFV